MLQALLEERFKLAVHREVKEGPLYELTVAKSGLKMKQTKQGSCTPRDMKNPQLLPGQRSPDFCSLRSQTTNAIRMLDGTGVSLTVDQAGVPHQSLTGQLSPSGPRRCIQDRADRTI